MKTMAILIAILSGLSAYGQESSWTIVTMDLPVHENFEPGTKLIFVIDYDQYTVIDFSNDSDVTARIIHHVSENGVALPDEKIGPVKYRTREFSPGETQQLTFNWEKGQEVTIEIYDGTMNLNIRPEKKRF